MTGAGYIHRMAPFEFVVSPPVERDPLVGEVIALIGKVCDLPEREEKWALLKPLADLLAMAAYPVMMVSDAAAEGNKK